MVKKTFSKNGRTCRVTFTVPEGIGADSVYVCGEFNDWSKDGTPLLRRKDGRFSRSLTLRSGQRYRFRYLLDGRWENDGEADAFVPNPFGTEDSVLEI